MLNNPDWGKPAVTQDPHTLGALIAWLETKPPEDPYRYDHSGMCLAYQYHQSIGETYNPGLTTMLTAGCAIRSDSPFTEKLERIAFQGKHTFGAALERARAVA